MGDLITSLKEAAKFPLLQIPYIKKIYSAYTNSGYPPGHFYSTIPLLEDVERNKEKIFKNENLKGIEIDIPKQMELVASFKDYYAEIPFSFDDDIVRSTRYQCAGAFYRFSDAVFLYSMIRHFKPKRIIEVGSGHSSAIMLDTNELFLNNTVDLTFIEPYPEERLTGILRRDDYQHASILQQFVQDVPVNRFQDLEANDILFIDSSHVSKIGSDVNYLFFEVLPELKPGVLIHIHDIFFPFELPREWIFLNKCFWNEIYLLRAFLMSNHDYEIILFNSMLQKKNEEWFAHHMPICLREQNFTGSMWLKKLR